MHCLRSNYQIKLTSVYAIVWIKNGQTSLDHLYNVKVNIHWIGTKTFVKTGIKTFLKNLSPKT